MGGLYGKAVPTMPPDMEGRTKGLVGDVVNAAVLLLVHQHSWLSVDQINSDIKVSDGSSALPKPMMPMLYCRFRDPGKLLCCCCGRCACRLVLECAENIWRTQASQM